MHFIQVDSNTFYGQDKRIGPAFIPGQGRGRYIFHRGTSVANPHGINIVQNKWYTVKVQVCGSSIMMKIWPQGDNEYPAWDMVTTDTSIPKRDRRFSGK